MEVEFCVGRFKEGVILGVRAIGERLARYYPGDDSDPNELPDQPVIIRG